MRVSLWEIDGITVVAHRVPLSLHLPPLGALFPPLDVLERGRERF